MPERLLFVGEKPSHTAMAKGWTWESGRLAANTLFRALRACGIDPEDRETVGFLNLFGDDPSAPEKAAAERLTAVNAAIADGWTVVAMGAKVDKALRASKVVHRSIVHPAARGTIRGQAVYDEHVSDALSSYEP